MITFTANRMNLALFKYLPMKMNRTKPLLIIFGFVLLIGSCQKRNAFRLEKGENSEDNKNLMDIVTGATQDANSVAGSIAAISGRIDGTAAAMLNIPCGASLDTSASTSGLITLNFDGTTVCDGRIRSGTMRLSLQNYTQGARWKNAGAILRLEMTNFRVSRISDNKSILLNGSLNFTNVNGGNIVEMIFGLNNVSSIVHLAEGTGISVTFDDGSVRTINLSRKITYSFPAMVFTVKIEGTGTIDGLTNVESWGQTRAGNSFSSQITEPITLNNLCYLWKPVAGKALLKVDADNSFELTTTLGVDNNGNIVSPYSTSCPYGYKIEWSYRNRTSSRVVKYY
jgi:hypothetical protein